MSPLRLWKNPLALPIALALLCFSGVSTSSAVGADDSVEVLPRWKKGEKLRYEIVKVRRRSQGDKTTLKSGTRTDLEIEVLNASEDGYVLGWTSGEAKFDDPKQGADPLARAMNNLLKDYRIVLELDSEAAIKGVQNWKEMQKTSAKWLDAMMQNLAARGADQGTVTKIRAQLAATFSTKQQIERVWTREAELFFMALGIELGPSKPLEYSDKLPNPLGGEPLPTRAQFALKELDRAAGRVTITWTQTAVPEEARRVMEKTLKDMARRMGTSVPDEDQLRNVTMADTAEFVIDVTSGWIVNLSHKRAMLMGPISQEDILTIVRKPE